MKVKKLLIYSVSVGVLAGIVTLITNLLQGAGFIDAAVGLTFVSFACWATYFLYGADPKSAVKAWCSMIVGIIAAVIIYELTYAFAGIGWDVPTLALPVAVVLGVILMCLGEKVPYANNVAAIFVGAALFFAVMQTPVYDNEAVGYLMTGIGVLAYGALGLVAGFLTVEISKKTR